MKRIKKINQSSGNCRRMEKRIVYKINEENRKEHVRKNAISANKFDSDLKSLQQNIRHTDTVYSKRKKKHRKSWH